jgi:phosphoribosylaminoimidazolecarboxamide formyltransferase/IMP cyclohydrolase
MPDAADFGLVPVRRALLSVSDKTGLADFARALHEEFGVELLSTGGTAEHLRDAGLPVTDVSDVTNFPEMMAGRVKTLHPNIHGALLGRLPEDEAVMQEHGIRPIDLVVVNLYPFEETVAKEGVTYEQAIENIDIGGPSMLRSAAKNHERVTVVCEPGRYGETLRDLREHQGQSTASFRQRSAAVTFRHTMAYDGNIFDFIRDQTGESLEHDRVVPLRYGENPHQEAVLVKDPTASGASVAHAKQFHGKPLGYINLLDADAALSCVKEFDAPACCIVKHATPCGVGRGETAAQAFERAYAGDPLAAFGGIVALNSTIDTAAAEAICGIDKLLEVIAAPKFEKPALQILQVRWKNVRLLRTGPMFGSEPVRQKWRASEPLAGSGLFDQFATRHHIYGGVLVQQRDGATSSENEWKVVTDRQPTDDELAALRFNWLACKHVKSNAVVVGGPQGTFGIGGGQVDRVAAAEQAVKKAGDRVAGAVAASDAFFPFPDGPKVLLDAGVTAIVQPGGSVRDQATIDLCNERGATMIFTGRRHFRH